MENRAFYPNQHVYTTFHSKAVYPYANMASNSRANFYHEQGHECGPYQRMQNQYIDLHNSYQVGADYSNDIICKKRRPRKVFSPSVLRELEDDFQASPYLTAWKRQQLAERLNLTERQVRVWFQNRRMRKKHEKGSATSLSSDKRSQSTATECLSTRKSPLLDRVTYTTADNNLTSTTVPATNRSLHHDNSWKQNTYFNNQFPNRTLGDTYANIPPLVSDYGGFGENRDYYKHQHNMSSLNCVYDKEETYSIPSYSYDLPMMNYNHDRGLNTLFDHNVSPNLGLGTNLESERKLSHYSSLQHFGSHFK